jgi:hypothetical protein
MDGLSHLVKNDVAPDIQAKIYVQEKRPPIKE